MRKPRMIILLFLLSLVFPFFSFGETIILKSGQEIQGKITEKTSKYIKIDFDGVLLTYYLDEIRGIKEEPVSPENSGSSGIAKSSGREESEEIFRKINPAIVYITGKTGAGEEPLGIGFIVNKSGVIFTSLHIFLTYKIKIPEEISVKLKDGKIYSVDSILFWDANMDLCVLKINAENSPFVSLEDSSKFDSGEKIYVINSNLDSECTLTSGMISGKGDWPFNWFKVNALLSPGNSGGPVINSQGKVIGMLIILDEGGQNINFAVSINEINKPSIINPRAPAAADEYNKNKVDYYCIEGNKAVLHDDYDKAISDYTKAIGIEPNLALAYLNRGLVYHAKGSYDQAISDQSKAIECNPKFDFFYAVRAHTYYDKKDYDNAWEDVHKAESFGYKFTPDFLDRLNKASGR